MCVGELVFREDQTDDKSGSDGDDADEFEEEDSGEDDDDGEWVTMDQSDEGGAADGSESESDEEEDGEWVSVGEGDVESAGSDAADNEGWESVSGSDDHSVEDEDGDVQTAAEAVPLDRRRMLTSEDFEQIERLRAAYARWVKDPRSRSSAKKVQLGLSSSADGHTIVEDDEDAATGSSFMVTADTLAPQAKTGKASKIDRLSRILEGRKENKFDQGGHAGGLTNKEKLRQKNYVMVRKGKKSVANKSKLSNSAVRYNNAHKVRQHLI